MTTQEQPAVASTSRPEPVPPAAPLRPPRRSFKSWLLGSLFGALVLIGLYTAFMLWFSYSEGERAGVLQKFSKRGWLCKTYEGELALYVVGGVAPQIWQFSVRDDALAEQLHKAVGQQLRVRYEEHRGVPTTCFAETDYYASSFEVIEPIAPPPSPSGQAVNPQALPATPSVTDPGAPPPP
ncbi:MAG: hypothetical protein ACR2I8_02280 [Steroidobacteraceae bacterium]